MDNEIKKAREEAGLTIKELADLRRSPYRTIQNWNLGERKPPEWIERLVIKEIKNYKKQ